MTTGLAPLFYWSGTVLLGVIIGASVLTIILMVGAHIAKNWK